MEKEEEQLQQQPVSPSGQTKPSPAADAALGAGGTATAAAAAGAAGMARLGSSGGNGTPGNALLAALQGQLPRRSASGGAFLTARSQLSGLAGEKEEEEEVASPTTEPFKWGRPVEFCIAAPSM